MLALLRRFMHSTSDIFVLRATVIIIFLLFGTDKWFDLEVEALKPLLSNTWLNILYLLFGTHGGSYFLGVVETITFIGLLVGYVKPTAGIVGDVLVIATGLVTLSLLPQLGKIDGFIVKDVLLIGTGMVLLKHALLRWHARQVPVHNQGLFRMTAASPFSWDVALSLPGPGHRRLSPFIHANRSSATCLPLPRSHLRQQTPVPPPLRPAAPSPPPPCFADRHRSAHPAAGRRRENRVPIPT